MRFLNLGVKGLKTVLRLGYILLWSSGRKLFPGRLLVTDVRLPEAEVTFRTKELPLNWSIKSSATKYPSFCWFLPPANNQSRSLAQTMVLWTLQLLNAFSWHFLPSKKRLAWPSQALFRPTWPKMDFFIPSPSKSPPCSVAKWTTCLLRACASALSDEPEAGGFRSTSTPPDSLVSSVASLVTCIFSLPAFPVTWKLGPVPLTSVFLVPLMSFDLLLWKEIPKRWFDGLRANVFLRKVLPLLPIIMLNPRDPVSFLRSLCKGFATDELGFRSSSWSNFPTILWLILSRAFGPPLTDPAFFNKNLFDDTKLASFPSGTRALFTRSVTFPFRPSLHPSRRRPTEGSADFFRALYVLHPPLQHIGPETWTTGLSDFTTG